MNVRLNYVVLVAAVAIGPPATVHAVGPESGAISASLSLAALVALFTVLPYEWKRDRRAAAAFVFAVCVVVLVGAGTSWALGDQATLALVIALGALVSASWLAMVLWRQASFEDLLPSWLDQTFPDAAKFEDDGVQWTFGRGTAPDEAPEVRVHLQNNVEATRTVELRLHDESGFALRSGALLLPGTFAVELAPRAHASVALPFRWDPKHSAKHVRLYCFLNASGPAAPRNRRQRAHPGPRPTPKWLVVLGPLAGHITTRRGGVHVAVERPARPSPASGPLLGRVDLLERPPLVPTRAPNAAGSAGRSPVSIRRRS